MSIGRSVRDFTAAEVVPTVEEILAQQGVPADRTGDEGPRAIAESARRRLLESIHPRAVTRPVGRDEFARIYDASGRNDHPSPIPAICGQAEELILFAATCGAGPERGVASCFAANDYPLGVALDAAASLAADAMSARLARMAAEAHGGAALPYSPGYCGWHVAGQEALFAALDPAIIELRLSRSCVMHPLKSVSGVIARGREAIHRFAADFDFCAACADKPCRARIASLKRERE